MSVFCQQIVAALEELAPLRYAEEWDNVGLQIESDRQMVEKIMLALTPSEKVIAQAVEKKVDFLLTHHPLIFKPLKTINSRTAAGRSARQLLTHQISYYAAHTNLDTVLVNQTLAEAISLQSVKPLSFSHADCYYKLAVYVPVGYEEKVREAICTSGAGFIGKYSHCTFQSAGTGTFLPLAEAKPFLGEVNRLERAQEYRLETIVPSENLTDVLTQMHAAHPYEEVAYDLYPLKNQPERAGIGVIGDLSEKLTLTEFMQQVKKILQLDSIRYCGERQKIIQRVAILGGSGASYINLAHEQGADVLLTGDLSYHDGQLAEELGLAVIDGTHFATEHFVLPVLGDYLTQRFQDKVTIIFADEKDFWHAE